MGGLLSFIWPVFTTPSAHVNKLLCWMVGRDLMVINDSSLYLRLRYTVITAQEMHSVNIIFNLLES